jgi:hypothetical protein
MEFQELGETVQPSRAQFLRREGLRAGIDAGKAGRFKIFDISRQYTHPEVVLLIRKGLGCKRIEIDVRIDFRCF